MNTLSLRTFYVQVSHISQGDQDPETTHLYPRKNGKRSSQICAGLELRNPVERAGVPCPQTPKDPHGGREGGVIPPCPDPHECNERPRTQHQNSRN
jgi:hypothetical protein